MKREEQEMESRVDGKADASDSPTASEHEMTTGDSSYTVPPPMCSECRSTDMREGHSICEACVRGAVERLSAIKAVAVTFRCPCGHPDSDEYDCPVHRAWLRRFAEEACRFAGISGERAEGLAELFRAVMHGSARVDRGLPPGAVRCHQCGNPTIARDGECFDCWRSRGRR